jgi:hypothetical protein
MKFIQYILDNKEWIFSGIGVPLVVFIFAIVFRRMNKEKSTVKNEIKSSVINLTNSNSNTIQLINNQTNYTKETKTEVIPEVRESLKEVFRRLDLSVKSIEIGLAPFKLNAPKTNQEYLLEAVDSYVSFSDYYDANEFLYDTEINATIKQIRELMLSCLKKQRLIEDLKNMKMPMDIIFNESKEIREIYEKSIIKEIPELRLKLTGQINLYFKN